MSSTYQRNGGRINRLLTIAVALLMMRKVLFPFVIILAISNNFISYQSFAFEKKQAIALGIIRISKFNGCSY